MDARKRKTKERAKETDVQCAHAQTTRGSGHEPFSLEANLETHKPTHFPKHVIGENIGSTSDFGLQGLLLSLPYMTSTESRTTLHFGLRSTKGC
jgi:hypothetical protein